MTRAEPGPRDRAGGARLTGGDLSARHRDHLADPVGSVNPWNVANALTVVRLVLVPVFLGMLLRSDGADEAWRWAAFTVFAVAFITDSVDGELARRRGLVTDFGKIADPIADKMLTGAALIGLSVVAGLPWSVTLVLLARELGVTLLRFWVIRHGVISASRGGKAKTMLLALAMGLYIMPVGDPVRTVAEVMMALAVTVALLTGADYVVRALRLRRRRRPAARA